MQPPSTCGRSSTTTAAAGSSSVLPSMSCRMKQQHINLNREKYLIKKDDAQLFQDFRIIKYTHHTNQSNYPVQVNQQSVLHEFKSFDKVTKPPHPLSQLLIQSKLCSSSTATTASIISEFERKRPNAMSTQMIKQILETTVKNTVSSSLTEPKVISKQRQAPVFKSNHKLKLKYVLN